MNNMKYLQSVIFFFCILFCCPLLFAQDEFVQFTLYDQVQMSADSNQLAFRCILFDESHPEKITTNIMLKDKSSKQLLCLNPRPDRFIISSDKKHLLFSSIYGLYLIDLNEPGRLWQLLFRDFSSDWTINNFGFVNNHSSIFIDMLTMDGSNKRELYKISLKKKSASSVNFGSLTHIDSNKNINLFNLSGDGTDNRQIKEINIKDKVVKFISESKKKKKGIEYNLVFSSLKKTSLNKKLIRNCRPRLLSINPDSNNVIISVFEQDKHNTYRFSLISQKLTHLFSKRYYSVSWLNNSSYICLEENGLYLRNIDLTLNKKLDLWELPEFCKKVELNPLRYELQVGFVSNLREAEKAVSVLKQKGYNARKVYFKSQKQKGFRIRVGEFTTKEGAKKTGKKLIKEGYQFWIDQISDLYGYYNSPKEDIIHSDIIIQYKYENYLRCRILDKKSIIIDEMNNIPNRTKWNLEKK